MQGRSIGAVAAGLLFVVAVTTLVDVGLHLAGVYAGMDQPLGDAQAMLATAYRVVIGAGGAWLTARLAPQRPMRHALILGGIGTAIALAGVVFTWDKGLGPRWYPVALLVLALPQSWAGARLYLRRSAAP